MEATIIRELDKIEETDKVRILLACESGSRAWGFASPDSDYDVRFIYAGTQDSYLSIADKKDVIELPVNQELDISGWDIRKTLQLFLKSNAALYEWLQSPIIYKEYTNFARDLRMLMSRYYSFRAGCHHYLSMTRNTFDNDLQGVQVKLKKYFYALRPALAAHWILEKQAVPPMELNILRSIVTDAAWQATVDELLVLKSRTDEKGLIAPISLLQDWIGGTITRLLPAANAIEPVYHGTEEMDELFRKYIPA